MMKTMTSQSTPAMLRRLRVKFVAVNMALAVLVLIIAFATICALDYRSSLEDVQASLDNAVSHSAEDGLHGFQGKRNGAPDGTFDGAYSYGEQASPEASEGFVPPQIGGRFEKSREEVPVAAYYVTSSSIVQMMGKSSASVSDSLLGEAVAQVLQESLQQGYLSAYDLYYAKSAVQGGYIIAFADGSATKGWQGLAWGLGGIGLVALIVLFVFNLLFSRWALRPVQKAWSQQQQFIADASHELKTPLTVILANSSILAREPDKTVASQAQWIESTKLEAERMQELVTSMLELARSDAQASVKGNDEGSAPLSFSHLVEGETLAFESVAFDRGILWDSSIEANINVEGNASRLQRLVAALLDNACKYTDVGHGVSVTLSARDGKACLRVRNEGLPISPEDLEHLFDRFYRVDKARTHNGDDEGASGFGLGLSIARQIAEEHKGTLTVASTEADGTIFTLELPLA